MAARKTTKKTTKNQKETVSAKQAKMVKSMRRGSLWVAFVPWLLGAVSVLSFICLLFPDSTGVLGPAVSGFLRGLFSVGAYLFPVLLLNIAIFWKRDEESGIRTHKIVFSVLFLLFFSVFCGIFATDELVETFAPATLFSEGQALHGGGLLGSLVANALIAFMQRAVTGVFCGLILLLSGCFLLGKTPGELFCALRDKWRENRERVRAYQEEGEGQEGDFYTETEELVPATEAVPDPKHRRGKKQVMVDEDETFDPMIEDNAPDEEELDFPLNDRGTDPECEDITELNPRRAATLTGAVAEVFGEEKDPDVLRRFDDDGDEADGEDSAEAFGAEVDLAAKKAEVKTPEKKAPTYRFPPLSLLSDERVRKADSLRECREVADKLVRTLETFHVNTSLIGISQGPTVTRYELQPEVGVRVKTIAGLSEDIALRLAARDVRIDAPIPGREAVGIEVPNKTVSKVGIRELLEDAAFKKSDSPLVVCLGMDVAGEHVFCNIAKMPHLLIAGATGSGKSVCINAFLTSILYKARPDEVKLILIDPKSVELTGYNGIAHLLVPVVCDSKKAAGALNWAVNEMERRYASISEKNVRNIQAYNQMAREEGEETMPHIVIVIDELADLMLAARDSVETAICRLAQKARAAGIHLVLGTQRPSVDVITGLIKSNIPSRIAFTVASQIDSRTILDSAGAERLLGNGDMLYAPIGATKPVRVQGSFVSEEEVRAVVSFLKQSGEASYSEETMADIEKEAEKCDKKKGAASASGEGASSLADQDGDDLFFKAVELALDNGGIATSLLQRRLSVGYARAARLIDAMEERGIVGPHNGAKPRELRITREEYMEMKSKSGDIG
ncbi:MAG: DNA translocase FtsK 4TM domain-containing protein [Clostridia bacterium]|nr:DNA translocase FtsK 4TM domain-containing protein [Clostridia bacterium]